jgi:assimilatory nitrate reductase catalytic subunit
MIVCVCRRVSDRAVDAAIHGGARDLPSLARATGAGADCGCCREELAARVQQASACSGACPGCPRGEAGRSEAA